MKKIVSFLVCASLVLSMSACNSGSSSESGEKENITVPDSVPKYTDTLEKIEDKDTYKNNLELDNAWENYGFGDPYIMKYNGIYYMYVSSPYSKTGIKVWTSKNAIDWEYADIVAQDRTSTYTAYSPKVVHYNGTFYLYTTPDGNGLHILTAPTPLGPFMDISGVQHPTERQNGALVPCTCKVHSSIDACIFIDDDGQWYLGHGHEGSGIEYHKMKSPTELEDASYYPGTVVEGNGGNKWTETGEIFKRNDIYFMTYSGNHVANDSYRTNWASSKKVLSNYTSGYFPLLTNTYDDLKGTGCGLVFQASDLVSDYVVYHNLINPNIGPIRGVNFDRIAYNGMEMTAYGVTDFTQEKPQMPTYYDFLDNANGFDGLTSVDGGYGLATGNDKYFAKTQTKADYVAEYNFIQDTSNAYIYFSYVDVNNYGIVSVGTDGKVIATIVENGKEQGQEITINGYEANALHTIRVDSQDGKTAIYVDSMKKFSFDTSIGAGKIGYEFSNGGKIGYTAFTNIEDYNSTDKYFKSYKGKVFAKDYAKDISSANIKTVVGTSEGEAISLSKGDYVRYKMNYNDAKTAVMQLTYSASGSGKIAVVDNANNVLGYMKFDSTDGKFVDGIIADFETKNSNYGLLNLVVVEGNINLYSFQIFKTETVVNGSPSEIADNGFEKLDGKWTSLSGQVKSYEVINADLQYANLIYGNKNWSNYEVSVDVKFDSNTSGNAGILFRAKNIAPITGSKQQIFSYNDQSYYFYISANGNVGLNKHNYNNQELKYAFLDVEANKNYSLKVVVKGNVMQCFVDGQLLIEYTDTCNPYLTGKVGVHSQDCTASYTNFKVGKI